MRWLSINGLAILFDSRIHIPFWLELPEACNDAICTAEIIPFPGNNGDNNDG